VGEDVMMVGLKVGIAGALVGVPCMPFVQPVGTAKKEPQTSHAAHTTFLCAAKPHNKSYKSFA
jgi:hypothetical protein